MNIQDNHTDSYDFLTYFLAFVVCSYIFYVSANKTEVTMMVVEIRRAQRARSWTLIPLSLSPLLIAKNVIKKIMNKK